MGLINTDHGAGRFEPEKLFFESKNLYLLKKKAG
jgi:hypothetical protein